MGWWPGSSRSSERPAGPPVPAWPDLPALAPTVGRPGPAVAQADFTRSLAGRRALATAPMLAPPAPHPQVIARATVVAPVPESAGGSGPMVARVVHALGQRARRWFGGDRAGTDIAFASEGPDSPDRVVPPRPRPPGTASRGIPARPAASRRGPVGPGERPAVAEPARTVARAPSVGAGAPRAAPSSRLSSTDRGALDVPPASPSEPATGEMGTRPRPAPAPRRLGLGPPRAVAVHQPGARGPGHSLDQGNPTSADPVALRPSGHRDRAATPKHTADEPPAPSPAPRRADHQVGGPPALSSAPSPASATNPARGSVTAGQLRSRVAGDHSAPSGRATAGRRLTPVVSRSPRARAHHGRMPAEVVGGPVHPTLDPAELRSTPSEPIGPRPPPTGAAAVQRTAAPPAAREEEDPDEVMERLYERISSRLLSELLVDRERRGCLVDLR